MSQTDTTPAANSAAPTGKSSDSSKSNNSGESNKKSKRRLRLIIAASLVLIALIAYGVYWFLFLRHFESTDDAYVAGNVVQVTPQVVGTVLAIHADDTELVQAGAVLIQLNPADAKVALANATAQLAQAVREVRTLYANNGTLAAAIAVRSNDVERARADLARRQDLISTGAVSKEDLEHARSTLQGASAALETARQQLISNQVLADHTAISQQPSVLHAGGVVQSAYLALARTTLPAPITGYVAKRSVQVGQRVSSGMPLLSVVPLDSLWVDANFKEVQIARMRIGQPVIMHSDLYGADITFHGKVAGLSAGTGSAFALLPSQNASGNWIKIVQRIPVRITLDPAELAVHPLRLGVSMQVEADIARSEGNSLTTKQPARTTAAYQTAVFDDAGVKADALIARIIVDNSGDSNPAACAKPASSAAR